MDEEHVYATPSPHSKIAVGSCPTIKPSECKICRTPASYKHFGVVACSPCKTFFKRKAEIGLDALKCKYSGNCEINFNTRHVCTSCRLAKCFASGMTIDMLRPPRPKKVKQAVTQINPVIKNEQKQLQVIPTLDLLRSDRSGLNSDQWNLISNLIHCYEERSGLSDARKYIREQTSLPAKLRFKLTSISGLFELTLSGVELFFKSNHHYRSLCPHDRSILLRSAMESTGSFGSVLIFRELRFFDQPGVPESIETLYGTTAKNLSTRLLDEVDRDITFVKLGIAMFAFSTTNCSSYTTLGFNYLTNIKEILRIQNMYTEVAWKYLLYKYNYVQAVKCFINFIRCFLMVNSITIETHQEEDHERMVKNLIEKMDRQVTINS